VDWWRSLLLAVSAASSSPPPPQRGSANVAPPLHITVLFNQQKKSNDFLVHNGEWHMVRPSRVSPFSQSRNKKEHLLSNSSVLRRHIESTTYFTITIRATSRHRKYPLISGDFPCLPRSGKPMRARFDARPRRVAIGPRRPNSLCSSSEFGFFTVLQIF
jgi:hypothetical protein